MQRERTSVRMRITSTTLTAAAIETKLGIKADETWKIGDRSGAFGVLLKDHGYALDAVALYTLNLADHMRALIKRVAPVAQKIGELSSQAEVVVVCVLACKAPPPLAFERDHLRWLASMGASIDVSVSLVAERPRPAVEKKGPSPTSES